MSTKLILVADDEPRIRRLLADFLKKEGFSIKEAANGREALALFDREEGIELIILDVMMPEYDGWAVCREIRKRSSVPIIMLTARGDESDELFGFELGADEYISKPFSPQILVARVQALLRRSETSKSTLGANIGISIDFEGRSVSVDREPVELSPKEYDLLTYLVANEGIALSREKILTAVWDYDYYGDTRTVDTHVKRLRAKLGARGEHIHTVRGFGYKYGVHKNEG